MYFPTGRSVLTFFGSGNLSGETLAAVWISVADFDWYQVEENQITCLTGDLPTSIVHNNIFGNNSVELWGDSGKTTCFHHIFCQFLP
jgi:hypothetical protein